VKLDRIAVLGAGGFLGSHLVPGLIERFGCEVDAVDIDFDKLECKDARIRRIQARVEDAAVMREVTSRSRVVLSLTALCNPAQYSTIPLQVIDANFTHLMPLVSLCAERKTRLIHFSTAEVYGRRALDGAGKRQDVPHRIAQLALEDARQTGPLERVGKPRIHRIHVRRKLALPEQVVKHVFIGGKYRVGSKAQRVRHSAQ